MRFRVFVLLLFITFLLKSAGEAYATGATMSVFPKTGIFNDEFKADIVIDGNGDKFNAAEADVVLSDGLAVKEIILGDCNFSFLKTPIVQAPSFSGIILSSYSTKCTAISLILVPTTRMDATVTLSNASVRRYGDAVDMLSAKSGASYSLTASKKMPEIVNEDSTINLKKGLYTVSIKILSSDQSLREKANVEINSVSDKSVKRAVADNDGIARFSNLQSGIYDVVVSASGKKIGEAIVNVSGNNPILSFGINLDTQTGNPLIKNTGSVLGANSSFSDFIPVLLAIGIVLGTIVIVLIVLLLRKRQARV